MPEPGGTEIKEDALDNFSATLAMMERNGTDPQTLAVYRNILQTIADPDNARNFDNTPTPGFQDLDQTNPAVAAITGQWLNSRVEIPGMPLITAENPDRPKFRLGPNYHNGMEWQTTVCVDDPRIVNSVGYIESRKPDGTWNRMHSVLVDPGDENNPGKMYGIIPGKDPEELSPGFRDRIDNAFLLGATNTQRTRVPFQRYLAIPPEVAHILTSDFKQVNGEPITQEQVAEAGKMNDVYKLALGGEIVKNVAPAPAVTSSNS